MNLYTADTIRDINEKEWNTLVGTDYLERSHAWYRTVEDSGMRKVRYVFVRENKRLTAAACCYVMDQQIFNMDLSLLGVGCPLGTSSAFFSKTPEQARMLLKGLEEIQEKEGTRRLTILNLRKEEFTTVKKWVKGFAEFSKLDNTYIDLDFTDFEDYLSSLDGSARRSVRKTLNRAQKRWGIKPVFTNNLTTWKEVACRLQGYICEQYNDRSTHFTEQFYEALEKNMKENAELLLLFKDSIPLVFGLSLNSPEISLHKVVGVDPQYREYQAYFLLYYEGIKRAIERRQKRIYYGLTTYEFKEKIGCKREELFGLTRLRNPVLNLALKPYVAVSKLSGKKFR